MRVSRDIDILCNNPEQLTKALLSLGYHRESRLDLLPSYEYARMYRGNVCIDIHRSFPVTSFSNQLHGPDLVPAQNPGIWHQTIEPEYHQVRYSDVLEHSMSGQSVETRDLVVPDPNMAVFLACTHIFRHLSAHLHRRIRPLWLGEFAEICDLARHPGFSDDVFCEIVESLQW